MSIYPNLYVCNSVFVILYIAEQEKEGLKWKLRMISDNMMNNIEKKKGEITPKINHEMKKWKVTFTPK